MISDKIKPPWHSVRTYSNVPLKTRLLLHTEAQVFITWHQSTRLNNKDALMIFTFFKPLIFNQSINDDLRTFFKNLKKKTCKLKDSNLYFYDQNIHVLTRAFHLVIYPYYQIGFEFLGFWIIYLCMNIFRAKYI